MFAPFRVRAWRRLWLASFVSQLGDWMQMFGRAAFTYQLTRDPLAVGWVFFAGYLPQMVLGLWSGVVADRFDRRRLLLVTQVFQLAVAVALGAVIASGRANLGWMCAASLLSGAAVTIASPASQALLPSLVPRELLGPAISLGTASHSLCRVAGPVLAAPVAHAFGFEWVFWANAISFVAVILVWVVTKVGDHERLQRATGDREAIRQAMRAIRADAHLWVPIVSATFIVSIGVIYQPLAPVFAKLVLADGGVKLGQTYASFLQAGIGIGAAVGILVIAELARTRPGAALLATGVAQSVALILMGASQHIAVAFGWAVLVGALQFAHMTIASTMVQHAVSEGMRGRVSAIMMFGMVGFLPIVALAAGFLAERFGSAAVIVGSGVACLGFSLWALRWAPLVRAVPGDVATEHDLVEARLAVGPVLDEEA